MLHLCKGMDTESLRPPIVNLILKGREHWDNVRQLISKKPKRVPVTLKVLKYLKRKIREADWPEERKLRIWFVCSLMWNGSLRVHEVLSKTKDNFDPLTTLCSEDLELISFEDSGVEKSLLRIHLISPQRKKDWEWSET